MITFVVSLQGADVFHGVSIICTDFVLDNQDKLYSYLESKYNLRFENLTRRYCANFYYTARLLYGDNRDIVLVAEHIPSFSTVVED